MLKTLTFSVVMLLFFSCKKNETEPTITKCIQIQIDSSLANPKGYLYYRIDAYKYQGNNVYLYYKGCCDRYDELKDENCNYLFAPSGGVGGSGDNSHPNFRNEATFIKTMWQDPRP